jgi:hypothetical protein
MATRISLHRPQRLQKWQWEKALVKRGKGCTNPEQSEFLAHGSE